MKKPQSIISIFFALALLSVLLYALQVIFFNAPRDTGFYIFQDLAFLPLQIAIVTVALGKYLKSREKFERLQKINMLINAFFSEAGTEILTAMAEANTNIEEVRKNLDIAPNWTDNLFSETVAYLKNADLKLESTPEQLEAMKVLMKAKREHLLRMIENQNVLEHDTFTDMLLANFHVMEELRARSVFDPNRRADMAHLSNDIQRAYRTLLIQWVEYMRYLRAAYPYLYSLEIRKNPFSSTASIIIEG